MPGSGTTALLLVRTGGSFTLVGGALTVVAPGMAAAGSEDMSATRVDSSSHDWRCAGAALMPGSGTSPDGDEVGGAAAGLTGNTDWQVGHLMRAPPGGIFLSSMFRTELQDWHETFMGAGRY
jgi:hypothetical protein